ncbi:ankyrin repeat-containing domain protein [Mycena leptocephala]|nr:ankyrin repeat-containing domain protein [Mycena leptocephala]
MPGIGDGPCAPFTSPCKSKHRNRRTASGGGCDPAAERDVQDHRPIHLAAMNGDLAMMKLLLAHGARVDDQCGRGESALHHACSVGNLQMVELLLDSGANLESRGYYGTALGFALHSRQSEIAGVQVGNPYEGSVCFTGPLSLATGLDLLMFSTQSDKGAVDFFHA